MNIILIGYRGTGKSVISKLLTKKLRRKLFPIDELIVKNTGKSIPQIIKDEGWERFRELETKIVKEVSAKARDGVIDCGGGVILNDNNMTHLKKNGKTVLLKASLDAILDRIKGDLNRPPLKKGLSFEDEQREILNEREPKYSAAADLICDTTNKKPVDTAMEIIDYFKKRSWI